MKKPKSGGQINQRARLSDRAAAPPVLDTAFIELLLQLEPPGIDARNMNQGLSATEMKIANHFRWLWRKRWDSNPRYGFPHAGFQDRFLKPLGHSSCR